MTQLQQYEKDVLQAEHDEQMKKLFESLTHMETAMEEASEQFEMLGGVDSVSRVTQIDSQTRCLPDVSGGVKEMSFVIDRHMRRVAELTEAEHRVESWVRDGEGQVKAAAAAAPVCEQPTCVIDAGGEVTFVTSCSRTDGFVGDKSGRVIKASLGDEDGVKLPNPCIFVAFWYEEEKDHLLVTSLDGSVNLRCHCDIDWNKWISDIHCDSKRQQLFIAQPKTVTVTDLSGCVTRVISDTSVNHSVGYISGIDGDDDKVIVFDCVNKKVFVMSKDTGELEKVVALGDWCGTGGGMVSLLDNKILLTDWNNRKVHKVCMITNQLITSFPTRCSTFTEFKIPFGVACDSRGLVFISDCDSHVVRVLLSDGTDVQTLGTDGESDRDTWRFKEPFGLIVTEGDTRSHLVVADCVNKRLLVFDIL
jgi:hypothetical protein